MMNGIEIKKTYPNDFEKIYPLLQEFDSPYTREDWNRIFNYQWEGVEDYVGFHLEHNGCVVGFLGLIFSYRYKDNRQYKFCNMTSLIVKADYRAATILLIRKLKPLKDIIFTGLSPINESYRILTATGFTAYERCYKIIPTLNYIFCKKHIINTYELPDLLEKVDVENRRIITDHANLKCKSILFDFKDTHCLLMYKITKQTYYGIPLKKVHILYISDTTLFNKHIHAILSVFNHRLGFLTAIYVDNRFIHQHHFLFSITKEITPPRISINPYRGQINIDKLYSEEVLLS